MAQPLSLSASRFDYPTTQPIGSLLLVSEQLNSAEADWLARASLIPKGEIRDSRKAQIRAFLTEMRSDIDKMISQGVDFARIASTINEKIVTFDLSFQYHRSYSAEYGTRKNEVQTGNAALSALIRQMDVDLVPYTRKKRSSTPVEMQTSQTEATPHEPQHQIIQKVYERIINQEQHWLKSAQYLPKEQKAPYLEEVRVKVKKLADVVRDDLFSLGGDVWVIDRHIEFVNESFDWDLERKFLHNTLYGHTEEERAEAYAKEQNDQSRQTMEGMFFLP